MTEPPPSFLTLRDDARTLLRTWSPPGQEQERLRAGFLDHLEQHPTAMWRHGPTAHLTASCVVLDPGAEHVLLALHRKVGMWLQLGGHLEPGDASVADGAAREVLEESGVGGVRLHGLVDLDRHSLPASTYRTCTEHLDLRFVGVDPAGRTPAVVTEESHDVRWWPVSALPAGTSPDLERLVAAGVRQVRAGSAR